MSSGICLFFFLKEEEKTGNVFGGVEIATCRLVVDELVNVNRKRKKKMKKKKEGFTSCGSERELARAGHVVTASSPFF